MEDLGIQNRILGIYIQSHTHLYTNVKEIEKLLLLATPDMVSLCTHAGTLTVRMHCLHGQGSH